MIIKEEYLRNHNSSGIHVGDKVKILYALKSGDTWGNGNNCWVKKKDEMVGKIYTIVSDDKAEGFMIPYDRHQYHFPYYILKKIETTKIEKYPIQIGSETLQLPQCLIDRITTIKTNDN